MDLPRRLLAEFIGTFMLVFVGVGSIAAYAPGKDVLSIGLAFGLTVAVMVSATGHISGAHFNPAVSVALVATGRMIPRDGLFYVLVQLAGATVASFLLRGMFGQMAVANGTPMLRPDPLFSTAAGLAMEVILTFILLFVIFGVAIDKRGPGGMAGLLIGLTVTLDILFGGPYTGASMNPARSFGPALASGTWTDHWVYWVGPLLGGVLAAVVYNTMFLRPPRAATVRTEPAPAPAPASETTATMVE